MASENATSRYAAEFVGTFLLVFTVGCNILAKTAVWAGVSIACVLMVSIYAFGGISGGNFNPAVSVSLGITKAMGGDGMEWKEVGIYCAVQIAAGISAGVCYLALFGFSFNLEPQNGFGAMEAGLCEVLYTFMLCFVVLNVAASKASKATPNQYYGLAIGFVVIAGAYGAGVVSGGCFNPAVAFGVDVSSIDHGFGWCFAYLAFELIGAALAAVLFKVVRPGDFEEGEAEDPTLISRLTSEFLGTYMLVLTVGLNVLGKSPAGAFSIAAALTSMIYALGDVSGAHFNPAVTVAVLCSGLDKKLTPQDAGCYAVVQIIGGIFAAMTYALIHLGNSDFPLGPGVGYKWSQVAMAETVFTFVLCTVVLAVACSPKTKSTEMFGLAIGSCVTVGGFAIGNISGGSLNPAVSFGIASAQIINGGQFYKALIYTVFEILGGAAAAGVYQVTHADAPKGGDDDAEKQG